MKEKEWTMCEQGTIAPTVVFAHKDLDLLNYSDLKDKSKVTLLYHLIFIYTHQPKITSLR